MKKITLLVLFCLMSTTGFSQSYQWAKKVAGSGSFNVTTSDVIAAGNGDIFVCGKFNGAVDFDPNATTVSRVSQGTDGFVAAYNPAGELEWVYTTDLAGNEEIPAISFYSPNAGFQITAVVKIGAASFKLVKLSRTVGGVAATSSTYSASVGVDIKEIDDRGYLVGGFTGTFDLGTGASALDLTNAGLSDGFCIKIGGTATTYTITETASYGGTGFDIINTISEIYLAGSFTGSLTLGSTTLTSAGGKDGLLFQFNNQTLAPASNLFNDKIGGTGDDEILTIYYDLTGSTTFKIKIGGYFSGTANFQIGSGGATNLTSAGGTDGFTVGYSFISHSSGGILVDEFIKHGGTGDDEIVDIAMNNNISTRYHFVGNTSLTNGGSLVNLGSIQNNVVTAYAGNFTPADATKITNASALAFTIDNVFYAGEFNSTTDFNITSTTSNLTFTTGGSNMFLQKSNACVNSATTPISISGRASVCVGNSLTMFIGENDQLNNINSNLNWKWYSGSCGGTVVGTGSTITVSPANTTTYYVRGEGGCVPDGGCIATGKTVTVYAIPNNGITLTGNTLSSSQIGNDASYQWVNCATNADISGAVGHTYTPTVNGSYLVKVSNPGGCLVSSSCYNVTLCFPAAKPTFTGNGNVCLGQSKTLSIASGTLGDSTSWKWYSGSCGGTLVGTGTSISVSPTTTTSYFVRGEGGCTANGVCSDAKSVTVLNYPSNAVTISGNTITATQSSGVTYQWLDCNNGNTAITGATSRSYTPTTSGNYAVLLTPTSLGCSITSNCTQVTICTSASTPTISGNSTVCLGKSITLSIATGSLNGSADWKWYSGSCGGTLVGTGASISVSPTSTTSYYARGEGGCIANGTCSGAKSVIIIALPNGAVTLTGNTLTATQSNNVTYQWLDCNNGNANIAGATNRSFTPTVTGSYSVELTSNSGCIVTSTCTQVSICTPATTPTISGNSSVCQGQTVTLSVATGSLNGSTEWRWYSGSCGGTFLGTGTSITVSPTATTNYLVRGEGGCVANGLCSTAKSVSMSGLPINAVTQSGNTLTATESNSVTYQWLDCNNGNSPISGATNRSFTPTVTGSYSVELTSNSGCIVTSTCTQVSICTPATTPTISGNSSVCQGQTVTLSVATGSLNGSAEWRWYSGSCGGTFLGTGTSITVTPTATTNFLVRGEGGCVANGTCSAAKTITFFATPNTSVTLTGGTLNSASAGIGTFQWVNCTTNVDITGETSSVYTPTASGSYSVRITNGGCVVTTGCTTVTTLSTNEFLKLGIKLYPNPIKNSFKIESETTIEKLVIYNLVGQQVKTFTKTNTYSIEDLTSGNYIVEITTEKGTAKTKIIKE